MNLGRRYEMHPLPEAKTTFVFQTKITVARALLHIPGEQSFEYLSKKIPTVAPGQFTLWTQLLMQEYLDTWGHYRGVNGLEYYVVLNDARSLYLPISIQERASERSPTRFSWNGEMLPPSKRIDKGVMHYAYNAGAEAAEINGFSASEVQMILRANSLIEASAPAYLEHAKQMYASALLSLAEGGTDLNDKQ